MAFQRKKPDAIGVKAPYPGFIEPELATRREKCGSALFQFTLSGTAFVQELEQ